MHNPFELIAFGQATHAWCALSLVLDIFTRNKTSILCRTAGLLARLYFYTSSFVAVQLKSWMCTQQRLDRVDVTRGHPAGPSSRATNRVLLPKQILTRLTNGRLLDVEDKMNQQSSPNSSPLTILHSCTQTKRRAIFVRNETDKSIKVLDRKMGAVINR